MRIFLMTLLAIMLLMPLWAEDSLVVDADGRVGVGTESPDSILHVKGDVAQMKVEATDGSILTVDKIGIHSMGWTLKDANENGGTCYYNTSGYLTLNAYKWGTNAGFRPLYLDGSTLTLNALSNGKVGIGVVPLNYKFQVVENGSNWAAGFSNSNGADIRLGYKGGHGIFVNTGSTSGYIYLMQLNGMGGAKLTCYNNGQVHIGGTNWGYKLYVHGSIGSLSDRKDKAGFEKIDGEKLCSKLKKLPVTSWHYKKDKKKKKHIGPVAQDVKKFIGIGSDGKSLCLNDLHGITLAALKEIILKNELQENKIRTLESQLAAVLKRLSKLEVKD